MAVAQLINTSLQVAFEEGLDVVSGKVILKNKVFNNVKTTATTEQLFAIVSALVPLQQKTLYSIKRNDTELITEE